MTGNAEDPRGTGLPPSMPLPKQIEHLLGKIRSLESQIERLEAPSEKISAEERAEERARAEAAAQKESDRQLQEQASRSILQARATAIRALVKLLPKAVKQAHAGKPALLRLILRATK